jgi:membrane protein
MTEPESQINRFRSLAERMIGRIGGLPAVARLSEVLTVFDRGGGGLVAAGLAYAALLALLPGLLLGLSVVGIVVTDPANQEKIVEMIGTAVPPLEPVARAALAQVSAGAVSTGIIAVIGLLWASSRFYAAIDTAFSHIFHRAPRRNPIVQSIRGLVLTLILVIMPVMLLLTGSIITWVLDLAPGTELQWATRAIVDAASPTGSLILFTVTTALCYRFVPPEHVPWRSLLLPAIGVGLVLAVFTQIYTFIAPRMVGWAALYGAFVAAFALLAWLSIGFNVLLFGAAWTEVRARLGVLAGPGAKREPPGS